MRMFRMLLIVCGLVMAGCGGAESEESEKGAVDGVMEDGAQDALIEEIDAVENRTVNPLDDSICVTIGERINGCGWLYTFETFAEDCAGWALSGNANKINGLEECAVKSCQPLLACLEEVVASP